MDKAGCSAGERGEKERIVRVLRSARLLARLPAPDLCRLALDASSTSCATGSVVFRRGDAAATLFIVASGHVGVFLGEPGDHGCFAGTAGSGDLLGEAGIVGATTYPVSAQVLAAGELIAIPTASMRRLMSEHFDTVLALMGEMSMRIRRQVREIMDLKMKTAPQRLAGHLAMLTEAHEGPAEVRLPYEKKLLASQLGMQPETLSRALMKLQTLGVSNGNGGAVFHLRDVALLRRYASEELGAD
jgi:CRP/FNR family transcriptional activator FtrB